MPNDAARPPWLLSEPAQVIVGGVVMALSVLLPDALGSDYWTLTLQLIGLFTIASIAQNLLLSDAGQASFGQGAVFGVAAYVAAIVHAMHGQTMLVSALAGVAAAVVVGLLFALPALRVQHFYLGFVTLSAAVVLPELAQEFSAYTNGITGISLSFPAWRARTVGALVSPLSVAIALLCVASLLAYWALRRTRFGRRLRVAAASPEAAQSLGVSPGWMRFAAFLIAAAGTGAAGVLYPVAVGFVAPTSFGLDLSMLFFFAVIVGGRGTLLGPIVGVWLLYLLPNALLAEYVQLRLVAYGAAALLVMLLFPDGVMGAVERWRTRSAGAGHRLELRVDRLLQARPPVAPPVHAAGAAAIEVRGGRKAFGSVMAVDGVDITVRRGEIHGLVGANGSGKTSLLNVLCGFSRLSGGTLHIDGRDITGLAPHRIARLGVSRTFQKPRIFGTLSLWENVQIGGDARRGPAAPLDAPLRSLKALLAGGRPDTVPHGQQRLIEVLRVALKDAHILLLDEPAAGLSPVERREFAGLLRQLRDGGGKTIVLVEHDLDFVWGVSDRITVLDAGKVVASGTPAQVQADPAARHLFIQGPHA